jgi:flagellin
MGLVINHNMMAMNAARNLSIVYNNLGRSMQRLSSGLRVNSAADDAAGLAIRELMRADITVIRQGVRNAYDGISMIQTAEGALSVIDEKLIRMKELAEQAATGTYTTVQREIMDSEYQAMAAEIDRIANATQFNGINLLNGSTEGVHGGSGVKIHFGAGNSASEDYYFVRVGDVRATPSTGLGVGQTMINTDVWYNENSLATTSGGAISSTNGFLAFAYDYDNLRTSGSAVSTQLDNIFGIFEVNSAVGGTGSYNLDDLVAAINQGTAARATINFDYISAGLLVSSAFGITSAAPAHIMVGNVKVGLYHSAASAGLRGSITLDSDVNVTIDTTDGIFYGSAGAHSAGAVVNSDFAEALSLAINSYTSGNVFAVWNGATSGAAIMVFAREAGAAGNGLTAWENVSGTAAGNSFTFSGDAGAITTTSAALGITAGTFYGGGEDWVTAEAVQDGNGRFHLQITGNATGLRHDIAFFSASSATGYGGGGIVGAAGWLDSLTGYDEAATTEWLELVDASSSAGAVTSNEPGRNILTQSAAQLALAALATAIETKDKVRASLGAFQNRLENTITQLNIQAENLQAAESRISDVDVAYEMTEFTKNMILAQAATAMLAQANAVSQIALQLLQV